MSQISKPLQSVDGNQVLQGVYNPVDKTISTTSFVTSKIGNKIVRTLLSSTVETYDYYDGATLLYTLTVTYTDSTLATIAQVERTA